MKALTRAEVEQRMLESLKESGLDKTDAKTLRVSAYTADEVATKLSSLTQFNAAGFKIPYFDINGRITPDFYRFRYVEEVDRSGFAALTRKKQLRYVQPSGVLPRVYWSPLAPWSKILPSAEQPLYITEGEKKASCGCKHLLPTIGLGGVWSFKSKANNVPLIKELTGIEWKDRRVYIVYDSDAASNRNILAAESALAYELLNRGANVFVVRIPDDVINNKKVGLDDFIVANGADAFQQLIEEEGEEFINSKALHDLNSQVLVISSPAAIWDLGARRLIATNNFTSTTHSHLKFTVREEIEKKTGLEVKMTEKSTAKEWLKWPGRASADTLEYEPGADEYVMNKIGRRALNVWSGWGAEPKKGDLRPWHEFMDYMFAGSNPDHRRWFEQWLAYPIQHPGTKLFSAVVVWSTVQGTGKTFVGHIMKNIYGENFGQIGMDQLNSTFNEWAANRQFILGDEIAGGENKRVLADRLKTLITQPLVTINTKFVPVYTIRDCVNYYFTSNHPDAFYLEDTDRRFFVHEIKSLPMASGYKTLDTWNKSEDGPAALLEYLLRVDLRGFEPKGAPPETEAKRDMREESKSEIGKWVAQFKASPDSLLAPAGGPLGWTLATTANLYGVYDRDGRKNQMSAFSRELRRADIPRANAGLPVKIGNTTQRLWIVGGDVERLKREVSPKRLADQYLKEHGDGQKKFGGGGK
jgi:hypothetical protein